MQKKKERNMQREAEMVVKLVTQSDSLEIIINGACGLFTWRYSMIFSLIPLSSSALPFVNHKPRPRTVSKFIRDFSTGSSRSQLQLSGSPSSHLPFPIPPFLSDIPPFMGRSLWPCKASRSSSVYSLPIQHPIPMLNSEQFEPFTVNKRQTNLKTVSF